MIQEVILSWDKLKEICQLKKIRIQYIECEEKYCVFAVDQIITYKTDIFKNPQNIIGIDVQKALQDLEDFEQNYKNNANRPLFLSPIEAESKFIGKYINLQNGEAEGFVEWSFDTDVEIRKVRPRPVNAQKGDRVELSAWVKPGVMNNPDYIKVREFGIIYLRGGDGNNGLWYEGIGTGKLPFYCVLRCYYYRENTEGEREFYIDIEFII